MFVGLLLFGVFIGFVNIVSAGGSLLTIPILIFMGLPPVTANGTNRISIIIQNLFAIIKLKDIIRNRWKQCLLLSVPAVIGSLYGAKIAINISDDTFNHTLIIIIILMIILIIFKPQKYLSISVYKSEKIKLLLLIISFLGIGIYGGFIQAGVGFLFIIVLSIIYPKMSLLEIHTIKTFVITLYLSISTVVYIVHGYIDWKYALYLSIGTAIGGYLGGRFALKVPERILQIVLIIIVSILILFLLIK